MGDPSFADRVDAGRRLAPLLDEWRDAGAGGVRTEQPPVVLGIPRGGVVVAAEVARHLGAPLDAAVVRKLGVPTHPEYAMGAIARGVRVMDPAIVRESGVTPEQFAFVEDMESVELQRRIGRFRADGSRVDIAGRMAIVVDDGVATGSTATAACLAVRGQGAARILLAVPVAPAAWRPEPGVCDDFVVCHAPREFWAVGQFYRNFAQTTDGEVERLLTPGLPR